MQKIETRSMLVDLLAEIDQEAADRLTREFEVVGENLAHNVFSCSFSLINSFLWSADDSEYWKNQHIRLYQYLKGSSTLYEI
jgi:hypothetical protein